MNLAVTAIGGAVAGFASGVGITLLNGGSLSQAFKNGAKGAIFGALSGAAAFGVGHMIFNSNVGSLLNPGSGGYGAAFEKAVMHGIVRAGMASLRGQKVSAGFWSGFVSSGFSVGTSGYGGTPGRTFIMAVVGGTTSELTGGKFANGAVTGAFVHLFNAEFDTLSKGLKALWNKKGQIASDAWKGLKGGLNGYRNVRDNAPIGIRFWIRASLTAVETGATWGLSGITAMSYDMVSGAYFDTFQTSINSLSGFYIKVYVDDLLGAPYEKNSLMPYKF